MSNPTSNFNWSMPTASDLVTDLPADFEVFGQAVDTTFADLKGGTTGQVLAKASGTDMDFTWVAQDDSNAIQNSIMDAKGDLIAATAADTPARLAIGTNGQILTADSTASTGMKWETPAAPTVNYSGCSAYLSSQQTLTAGAYTAILWNAESWDVGGYHDNSTNPERFTVPAGKAGYYSAKFSLGIASNNAGQIYSQIGSSVGGNWWTAWNVTAGNTSITGHGTFYLNVGDYLYVNVYKANALVTSTGDEARFTMDYLGA